jgi:Protein of unknown function (DUF2458)
MEPYGTARNPQLASILQNLAQFSQPAGRSQCQIPENAYVGQTASLDHGSAPTQITGPSPPPTVQDPKRRSTTPRPDSSIITEWSPAVKYVMNTLSQNPEASAKMKRLIKNQHDNERQWWAGREALIAKHRDRVENKKKADDLLRSLGAAKSYGISNPPSTAAEEKAEVERYDKKVYTALSEMVAAIDRELTTLRVPFFAIKHELVQKAGGAEGVLCKAELVELQKKMLQLLQDLFGD